MNESMGYIHDLNLIFLWLLQYFTYLYCGVCCRFSMGTKFRNWRDAWRELGLRVWVLFTMSTLERLIPYSREFLCRSSLCVHSLCRASVGADFAERSPRGSSRGTASLLNEYAPVLRHLHHKLLRVPELACYLYLSGP